ncbi:type 3 dihydrofolate reductase [Candidatus Erwinia haradaeae]|uniref:Dihydrofolate reductase n=1 Tax=Candidatus Erwinia haradaeae TaxID=1922217 RepID=A0A451D3D0_9GAMM|nr:type 3 dihydrofolate reductase [Candidatus Erwinia haradaeae]VFP80190.1 Dihydrofolate reductase [Candidatus Erwinia haradaeae]
MISLIAALTSNCVIGRNNTIPWVLPADLDWFKKHTINKPILMGRLTWETLPCPLSERLNIVMSHYRRESTTIVKWVTSIEEALIVAGAALELMVIGGGKIYQQFMPKARRLYLTHINTVLLGDTYFPNYDLNQWKKIFSKYCYRGQSNKYNLYFEILERKNEDNDTFKK